MIFVRLFSLLFLTCTLSQAQQVDWVNNVRNKPFNDVRYWNTNANGIFDNYTKIQSAIIATCGTGGALYFPGGSYLINSISTLSLSSCSNVSIIGANTSASIILQTSGNVNMLSIVGSNDDVDNIQFSGQGKSGGFAIYTNGTSNVNFNNVTISNVPNGYDINNNNTSVTKWNQGYISGLQSSNGVGIRIGNVGNPIDNYIHQLIINGNGALADIQVYSTGLLVISDSDFLLSNYPLEVIPSSTGQVVLIFATNTFFDTGAINPLFVNATGGGLANVGKFTNDWFASSQASAGASLNGNLINYTFDSCEFINNQKDGIDINGVSNVTVSNSTFNTNSQQTNAGYNDIFISGGSSHIVITGNRFLTNNSINSPSANLVIGVGTVNDLIVSSNDFDNFINAPINDLSTTGTSTLRVFTGNVNPVTPTIAAAATINLTPPSDIYYISGSTAITAMSPVWINHVVKLLFTSTSPAGVTTGGAANINFATSHSATQYQILTCTYYGAVSGINWACQ